MIENCLIILKNWPWSYQINRVFTVILHVLYLHLFIQTQAYCLRCDLHYCAVIFRLYSPEKTRTVLPEQYLFSNGTTGDAQAAPQVSQPTGISSPSREQLVLYVPEMEEIRITPVVARKGYLNILEQKTNGWKKRWVVRTAAYFIVWVVGQCLKCGINICPFSEITIYWL